MTVVSSCHFGSVCLHDAFVCANTRAFLGISKCGFTAFNNLLGNANKCWYNLVIMPCT